MQLRYLKRVGARSLVWPHVGSRDGLRDTAKLRLEGILTNVLRIGERLSVTIRFEGRDYVVLLGRVETTAHDRRGRSGAPTWSQLDGPGYRSGGNTRGTVGFDPADSHADDSDAANSGPPRVLTMCPYSVRGPST
jgi:hypothetical protein